jgi:hypothetical protein
VSQSAQLTCAKHRAFQGRQLVLYGLQLSGWQLFPELLLPLTHCCLQLQHLRRLMLIQLLTGQLPRLLQISQGSLVRAARIIVVGSSTSAEAVALEKTKKPSASDGTKKFESATANKKRETFGRSNTLSARTTNLDFH